MIQTKNHEKTSNTITFDSTRFGRIKIEKECIITFKQGIIGFPDIKEYVMLENIKDTPFIWFQAVGEPSLCFLIVDPKTFKEDYTVRLDSQDQKELKVVDDQEILVVAIVSIKENVVDMTANLKGPIVINTDKKIAKQVVLVNEDYSTQHKIFR